jgi:hypothetical protein
MKIRKVQSAMLVGVFVAFVTASGCATMKTFSDNATVNKGSSEEDWKKRTGWENEKTDNPGWWGVLAGLGSFINK